MKRFLFLIAVVAMVLPGCQKISDELAALDDRLDKLEQRVPTVDEQIASIQASLVNLEAVDKELAEYIEGLNATAANLQEQIAATNDKINNVKEELKNDIAGAETSLKDDIAAAKASVVEQLEAVKEELESELEQINATIVVLQEKESQFDQKIADLKKYVDTELCKTTDWVTATFATLEQYNALVSEVATIKEQIKSLNDSITALDTRLTTKINEEIATVVQVLDAEIQQKIKEVTDAYTSAIKSVKDEITTAYNVAIQKAINTLDASLKSWVGEQLSNYYTIAEIEAKITALQNAIVQGDKALQDELNKLKLQLETTAAEITAAYKKAIEEAINTNNGVINAKIASEIAAVNQRIDSEVAAINAKIAEIEARVEELEEKVDELISRKLEITFDSTDEIAVIAGESCRVNYNIVSSEADVHIATIAQNGWKATITKTTERSGYITVYAPNPLTPDPIIVLVSDANTTIMRTLTFVDGITTIATEYYAVTDKAATLNVTVQTNIDYTINIPSSASKWITLQDITSRAMVREDTIVLNIAENHYSASRTATLQLVCKDIEVGTITIYQQGTGVASNELVYTSFDGKIIEPYQTMGFNANIVSNTYSNGRGLIVFDRDITTISEYAFYGRYKLTSIKMPKTITTIKEYAFYRTSLAEIEIPEMVTDIKEYAFYMTNITNLVIPDKVITIGDDAFSSCTAMTALTIGKNVTTIGKYAFSQCSMKNIVIGNRVTSIGKYAFYECSNLTSITIPDSVTEIGVNAFYNCTSLTSVTIGNSVEIIRGGAFSNCSLLTSVYCKPTNPPALFCYYGGAVNSYPSFDIGSTNMKIYVPRDSYNAYSDRSGAGSGTTSQENWGYYKSNLEPYDF